VSKNIPEEKYPVISQSWRNNQERLIVIFAIIISTRLTAGNVDDRTPVPDMASGIMLMYGERVPQ
ncbi:hypothetical protein D7O18_26555, partial [Salmonella enterica subsp. enterica serovar Muenchen]|nr:hypothetical protein [Salmonella enterica subsp. enterica serovar Muenchen]